MDSSGITSRRMPTEQEWARMSWRARDRFLKSQKPRNPDPVETKTQRRKDPSIVRCGNCGAWMLDKCGTGCDS